MPNTASTASNSAQFRLGRDARVGSVVLATTLAAGLFGCNAHREPLPDVGDVGDDADVTLDTATDVQPDVQPDVRPDVRPDVPEPTAFVGSPCATDATCDYPDSMCLTSVEGYPDGMCTQQCTRLCPDAEGFPTTFCVDVLGVGQCHARCDYGVFPAHGCRDGYMCELIERYNEPASCFETCLPSYAGAPPPDAPPSCVGDLRASGVVLERTCYAPQEPPGHPELECTIDTPIRLHSPVDGIRYRYLEAGTGAEPTMLMACALADAIHRMNTVLARYDIVEVVHLGTTNCRVIGDGPNISQHGYGQAIDLAAFVAADGTLYSVPLHWEHDTQTPVTHEGQVLYEIAYAMHDEKIFNNILTPNYNAAHDDHFHVDLQPGEDYIKSGEEAYYIGPERWSASGCPSR